MKAFLIPPTESDQKDTDLKAVGVKSMKIGEILNMGRESVAITGAYKSDSHHLLHTTAHMRSFLLAKGISPYGFPPEDQPALFRYFFCIVLILNFLEN